MSALEFQLWLHARVDRLDGGRNGCELIGMFEHKLGRAPQKIECKRRSKHDLHGPERIQAIGLLDQVVVLANGSGEVPLQEELKTFHI